jgi:TonB family protein
MFNLLSQESVSETPGKAALYASCTIHCCVLIILAWFSISSVPGVHLQLTTVYAGSPEPVREPQRVYIPQRNASPGIVEHAQPVKRISAATETPHYVESADASGFTTKEVPSEFLALADIDPGSEPAVGITLSAARTNSVLLKPEVSLPPPEPPPGEPDVKPPVVIGGRLEPAQLIKETMPVYPPMARTARVEGVVVLEGTINVNGAVETLRVVSGHPMLVDEAIKAVKKWKYRPAILNGQPTPSPITVTVRFTLKYGGG